MIVLDNARSRAATPAALKATAIPTMNTGDTDRPVAASNTPRAKPAASPPRPQVTCEARNPEASSRDPAACRRSGSSWPSSRNRCRRAPIRSNTGSNTAPNPVLAPAVPRSADCRGPNAPRYGVSRRASTDRRNRGNALTINAIPTPPNNTTTTPRSALTTALHAARAHEALPAGGRVAS